MNVVPTEHNFDGDSCVSQRSFLTRSLTRAFCYTSLCTVWRSRDRFWEA